MFLRRKLVKSRLKIAGKQPLGSRDRTSNHSTRISSPRSTLANVVQPPSKSSVKEKTNTSQLENTNFRPFKIIPRGTDIFLISSISSNGRNRNFFSIEYQFHPPSIRRFPSKGWTITARLKQLKSALVHSFPTPNSIRMPVTASPSLFPPLWPWQWHRRFIYGSLTFWSTS